MLNTTGTDQETNKRLTVTAVAWLMAARTPAAVRRENFIVMLLRKVNESD